MGRLFKHFGIILGLKSLDPGMKEKLKNCRAMQNAIVLCAAGLYSKEYKDMPESAKRS
jgi:hypothetical protein